MKSAAIVTALAFGLYLFTSVPAQAQHRDHGDHHAAPQRGHEDNHSHGHSAEAHGAAQGVSHHEEHRAEGVRPQHAAPRAPERPHYAAAPRPPRPEARHVNRVVERDVWQRDRAAHWRTEHRSWRDRGGYHGYRIPEDRFHAEFGRAHWFRVRSVPIIVVNSHPRFQYGGFWFSLVDPWPETWARTWYETDDVCVDYVNDGYYLFNRRHPGVAIAVSVSF
jgi:hypothetical protein